ncbi:hypothetical protein DFQ27_002482, partial [Actinomortierella ambigua]
SPLPKVLIDFVKRGIVAISRNLLSIGAATSQEDGRKNHDAVASNPTASKEKRCSYNDEDKELDAGRSAMPVSTCKRPRSSVDYLLDEEVYNPDRVKLRKTDRLALLAAAFSTPPKVEA